MQYSMQYSIQLTDQISNDPSRIGAKSTTTSNHPSTPIEYVYLFALLFVGRDSVNVDLAASLLAMDAAVAMDWGVRVWLP